jgi:exosome complex RNA-binding protein Rrp4
MKYMANCVSYSYNLDRRGHGTYIENEKVVSSVAGVVDRVNKLISVRPLHTRYIHDPKYCV